MDKGYIKPDGQSLIQEGDESRRLVSNRPIEKEFSQITNSRYFSGTVHSFEFSNAGDTPTEEQQYEIRRPVPVEEKYHKPADDGVIQIGDECSFLDKEDWVRISIVHVGTVISKFISSVSGTAIYQVRRPNDNAPNPVSITFDVEFDPSQYQKLHSINDIFGESLTKQEDVLEEALRITSGDRQNQYGPPDQDFRRTATMANALWADRFKDGMGLEPHDIAQFMILMKLSRLQHQKKRDSVVDIAGYSRCMDRCYVANGGYPVVKGD